MGKELKIKATGKEYIYGTLTHAKKKSNTLVIFVHGFTGHKDEHIHFNGAKFLTENGLDTFRLNLYGYNKEARHFRKTKISLHGQDITTVVEYFRKKYKKIFVIGHSYGGTSLLFVEQSFVDGFVFWDASYVEPKKDSSENLTFNKTLDGYILDWGIEYVVGKSFIEELEAFPDCLKLMSDIQKPVLLITAGKKGLGNKKAGQKYFKAANHPKKLVDISEADHNFNDFKAEEKLLRETFSWIKGVKKS